MNIAGKKVAYITLGCKLNFSETSTIRHSLEKEGTETVADKEGADIFVINTCSVTDMAEKKGRQLIRKIIHHNPGAYIVVVGCYAQLRAKEIMAIDGVSLVLGAGEKFNVAHYLQHLEEQEKQEPHSCDIFQISNFDLAYSFGDRTRCFLKIQDGCDYFCTYCTIPFARGRSRSASLPRILDALHEVAGKGIQEVILTGVNTGDFGRTTGERFIDLLRALDAVEGIERYRISSIEPNLLTDEIIDFCASSPKFQHHFHIPLQSGSDRILGLMRRRYTTARFADRIAAVRRRMPDAFIGIDVIVGFPGETEADFRTTYDFLTGIAPAFLHIFPFSERPGTPAVDLPGKVQASVASERVKRLEALCDRLHGDFCRRAEGTESAVLFESTMRGGMMFGFTGNYIRVKAPYERAFINRICRVRLGAMDGMHDLAGEIVRDNGETERL